jgi:hypothetical protein
MFSTKTQERGREEQETETTPNFSKDAKLRWRSDRTLWVVPVNPPRINHEDQEHSQQLQNCCASLGSTGDYCRRLVSDRTPGDTLVVLLGRTVLLIVARWFVLGA